MKFHILFFPPPGSAISLSKAKSQLFLDNLCIILFGFILFHTFFNHCFFLFLLQSFEASKRNSLSSRFEKFSESLKKKEEEEQEKMKQQKEKLEKELELHNEKREAYLNEIKSKLKDHVSWPAKMPTKLLF